jgi:hypothetical protein
LTVKKGGIEHAIGFSLCNQLYSSLSSLSAVIT